MMTRHDEEQFRKSLQMLCPSGASSAFGGKGAPEGLTAVISVAPETPETKARRSALAVLHRHLDRMDVKREWGEALYSSDWRGDELELVRRMREPDARAPELIEAIAVVQASPMPVTPKGMISFELFNDPRSILEGLVEQSEYVSVREAAREALSAWNEQATKTLVEFAQNMALSRVYAAYMKLEQDDVRQAIKKADKKDPRVRAVLSDIAGLESVERSMPEVAYAARNALAESQCQFF